MLDALGQGAECEHFRPGRRRLGGSAVAQHAGKLGNLGDPAAIDFLFTFDGEVND